jgi:DNA-binding IclR family transcriptional regulator
MSEDSVPAIQTVQRAAVILNAFTVARPQLTLSEITQALGSTKATAHRYAKALREVGLLRYDQASATYTLGPQLLSLESVARSGLSILAAAGPHMEKLLKTVNQTVVLSVWDGETAGVVRCLDNTTGSVRLAIKPGARLDLFESAQGRVFCAYLDHAQVPGLDRRLRFLPGLEEELEQIRQTGVSVNSPAVHGVRTIAAPVFEYRKIAASLAVVGTAVSLSSDMEAQVLEALKEAAIGLSADLGTPADEWPISPE